MRVKLDENLGKRGEEILRNAACDVATVVAQGLLFGGGCYVDRDLSS